MTDFKDSKGRIWTLKLTLGSAKEIYDRLKFDVLNPAKLAEGKESILSRLSYDTLLVGEIVAILIEKQAKERGVENILDAFDGETCAAMHDAFLDEYQCFFADRKNDRAVSIVQLMKDVAQKVLREHEEILGETSIDLPDVQDSLITPTSLSTN